MTKSREVCWELFRCRDRSCPVYGDHIVGNPERMDMSPESAEVWQSGLLGAISALSCPYFRQLRERGRGRRAVDRNLDLFLERALRRAASFQRRLALLEQAEVPQIDEITLLGQFSQLIPTLKSVGEVCFALLTVITASQGLGFNRAMLFWWEEEQEFVYGHGAIGPQDDQEAHRIWEALAEREPWLDLAELVGLGLRAGDHTQSPLARRVRDIRFPADKSDARMFRALFELQELHGDELVHAIDRRVSEHLDLQHFVTLPLLRRDRSLGFLAIDNRFSGVSLAPERVDIVQVLTRFAASILENLQLMESLERSLSRTQATMEVLTDIRRRIAQAEKLAASGELSAAVAHEIRNPLTAIGGFSRRLLRSENLSEEDRRTVAVIAEESLRLEETLGRLLHRAQREELQLHPCDLNSEIQDLLRLLKDRVAEAGIELSSELDPDLIRVPLDSRGFRQVLLNLVQNAIEAIEEEGRIEIRTERENGWVLLHVSDNGCGMSREQRQKIFRSFYTTKRDGTGLGLAISQRLIRRHGGELTVTSTPGEGTCFTVRLPEKSLGGTIRVLAQQGSGHES